MKSVYAVAFLSNEFFAMGGSRALKWVATECTELDAAIKEARAHLDKMAGENSYRYFGHIKVDRDNSFL